MIVASAITAGTASGADRPTLALFEAALGQRARLHTDGETVDLTVAVVEQLRSPGPDAPVGTPVPFSVQFAIPPGVELAQDVYRVELSGAPEITMLLVPISPPGDAPHLEALFA